MARMERSCFACISCRRVGWASATVGGRRRNVKACGRTAMRGSREDHTDTARRISNAQQTHQPLQETHLEHQAHTFISRFRMCRRTAPRGELYKTRQSNTKCSETCWEQLKTIQNQAKRSESSRDQREAREANKTGKLAESPKSNNTKQKAASAAEASTKYIKPDKTAKPAETSPKPHKTKP